MQEIFGFTTGKMDVIMERKEDSSKGEHLPSDKGIARQESADKAGNISDEKSGSYR